MDITTFDFEPVAIQTPECYPNGFYNQSTQLDADHKSCPGQHHMGDVGGWYCICRCHNQTQHTVVRFVDGTVVGILVDCPDSVDVEKANVIWVMDNEQNLEAVKRFHNWLKRITINVTYHIWSPRDRSKEGE